MVSIIKNGRDKVFYAKCPKCTTEFIYALSDVQFEKEAFNDREISIINCPECGTKGIARMLTQEEYEDEMSQWQDLIKMVFYHGNKQH